MQPTKEQKVRVKKIKECLFVLVVRNDFVVWLAFFGTEGLGTVPDDNIQPYPLGVGD